MKLNGERIGFAFFLLALLSAVEVDGFIQQDNKVGGVPKVNGASLFGSQAFKAKENAHLEEEYDELSSCSQEVNRKWMSRVKNRFRVFSSVRSKVLATAVCAVAFRFGTQPAEASANDVSKLVEQTKETVKAGRPAAFVSAVASSPKAVVATAGSTIVVATGAGTILKRSSKTVDVDETVEASTKEESTVTSVVVEETTEDLENKDEIVETLEKLVEQDNIAADGIVEEEIVEEIVDKEDTVVNDVVEEEIVEEIVDKEDNVVSDVVEEEIVEEIVEKEDIVVNDVAEEEIVEELVEKEDIAVEAVEEEIVDEVVVEDPVEKEEIEIEDVSEEAIVEEVVVTGDVIEEQITEDQPEEEEVVAVKEEEIVEVIENETMKPSDVTSEKVDIILEDLSKDPAKQRKKIFAFLINFFRRTPAERDYEAEFEAFVKESAEVTVQESGEIDSARKFRKARQQPKSRSEEARLASKYAAIDDVGERAFQILLDLGMVELTPNP